MGKNCEDIVKVGDGTPVQEVIIIANICSEHSVQALTVKLLRSTIVEPDHYFFLP